MPEDSVDSMDSLESMSRRRPREEGHVTVTLVVHTEGGRRSSIRCQGKRSSKKDSVLAIESHDNTFKSFLYVGR